MESIFERRSIRKFTNQQISEDDIALLLKAGMNAPSARNLRPCQFIVINDKDVLNNIVNINYHSRMLSEASHAIIVCAKEVSEFWPQDAAATTENILIQATSMKIGSCWTGIYPKDVEKPIKELLNVPNDIRVFSIIALGYANEVKEPNNYYNEEIIHYNHW